MSVKKIAYKTLYMCAALLAFVVIIAELSPKIEVFALQKLCFGTLFIAILVLAGELKSSLTQSDEERRRIARNTLWAIFAFYIFNLIWLLYFDGTYDRIAANIDFPNYIALKTNFVPLVTIRRFLRNISNDTYASSAVLNLAGNLAAFMPLGFFCPLLVKFLRKPWFFIPLLLTGLIGIEGLQLLLRVGSCDVDDVILNFLGAASIYSLMLLPPIQRYAKHLDS